MPTKAARLSSYISQLLQFQGGSAMYVRLENAQQFAQRTYQEITNAIKQHEQFLVSLEDDSDWAFAIKAHAFLEVLVTSLIRSHSGNFNLGEIAQRLPMNSSDKISKLELVSANQLLSTEQVRFIKMLGEVRNRLAHDVSMVDAFSFEEHIGTLDANQKKNWRRDMSYAFLEDPSQHSPDVSLNDPRKSITCALLDIICTIEGSRTLAVLSKDSDAIAREDTKQLIESLIKTSGATVETGTHSINL
jgi:hypothetical protein